MTAAAIAAQPVQITAAVTNQLNKTSSSSQMANESSTDDGRRDMTLMTPTPGDILEKSQKTLATIKKTVNEATEEIHKTIEENLSDLKTMEKEMCSGTYGGGSGEPTTDGGLAVDAGGNAAHDGALQKKASSRTLKSDKVIDDGTTAAAETVTSPIEATVNVIETGSGSGSDQTRLHPQDSEERVSERAISVGPEAELQGSNVQKIDNSSHGSNGAIHVDPSTGAKNQT